MTDTPTALQGALLERKHEFFNAVAEEVRAVIPEVTSIWCFGLHAMNPMLKKLSDWDFIAMVPPTVSHEGVQALNELNSPLDQISTIMKNELDIQALRIDEESCFAELLRKEGFIIWRDGEMAVPEHHYLARSA